MPELGAVQRYQTVSPTGPETVEMGEGRCAGSPSSIVDPYVSTMKDTSEPERISASAKKSFLGPAHTVAQSNPKITAFNGDTQLSLQVLTLRVEAETLIQSRLWLRDAPL